MSTWLDKPDADGLWWRCCGGEVTLCVVGQKRYAFIVFDDGTTCVHSSTWEVCKEQAKWQRCELTRPEPYKPPQPPKVEQYTAIVIGTEAKRFLTRIGDIYAAHELNGTRTTSVANWDFVTKYYTDITPLESPP